MTLCTMAIDIAMAPNDRNLRKRYLDQYDYLPTDDDFKDIDRGEFFEINERHRNARTSKKGLDRGAAEKNMHKPSDKPVKGGSTEDDSFDRASYDSYEDDW